MAFPSYIKYFKNNIKNLGCTFLFFWRKHFLSIIRLNSKCKIGTKCDFFKRTKKYVLDFWCYFRNTLYLMGKSSKVVGNWLHMDFFGLIENQVLADYDVKIFFNFQNFLSWGLALVYSILDHIKLNFYTSNLWSQNVSLFSVLHTPWIFPQKWGRQNMSLEKIYFAL